MDQVRGRAVTGRHAAYPGADGAGHGILLQHPAWTQEQIYAALTNG